MRWSQWSQRQEFGIYFLFLLLLLSLLQKCHRNSISSQQITLRVMERWQVSVQAPLMVYAFISLHARQWDSLCGMARTQHSVAWGTVINKVCTLSVFSEKPATLVCLEDKAR